MTFLSSILVLASFVNAYLAFRCFKFKNSQGAVTFGWLLLSILFYCVGYAFEIQAQTPADILFWLRVEYIGISYFPAILIIFGFQFLGLERWLKKRRVGLLLLLSTGTLLAHFSNASWHLFYKSVDFIRENGYLLITTQKGWWYWVHQSYSVVAMVFFNSVFIYLFFQPDKFRKRHALTMFLASMPPWIFYVYYISGYIPCGFDPIPFSFILMTLIMGWGMFKYRIFEINPVAMNTLFDLTPDGIIITDMQYRITNYNQVACQIFGVARTEYIGKALHLMLKNIPLPEIALGTSESLHDIEMEVGNLKQYYELKSRDIIDSKGQKLGITLIFHDITERKLNELQMLQKQEELIKANHTREKLISIIGHDLRGPIGNITNIIELLNKGSKTMEEADKEKMLDILSKSSEQSLKLIENLMLWAKAHSNALQCAPMRFNLSQFIKSNLELVIPQVQAKELQLTHHLDADLMVVADPQMLSVVVRNLLSNAIKFTNRNGKIDIYTEVEDGYVRVRFEDNGIGIPEQLAENLSDLGKRHRAGTEKESGTGLGLMLCMEFMSINLGNLGFYNRIEGGSCFYFTLPLPRQ